MAAGKRSLYLACRCQAHRGAARHDGFRAVTGPSYPDDRQAM